MPAVKAEEVKIYKCPQSGCNVYYSNGRSLNAHLRTKHGIAPTKGSVKAFETTIEAASVEAKDVSKEPSAEKERTSTDTDSKGVFATSVIPIRMQDMGTSQIDVKASAEALKKEILETMKPKVSRLRGACCWTFGCAWLPERLG